MTANQTSTRYHKKPNRRPGYDYSQPGTYFVTLCAEHRQCLFGTVADGVMLSNDVGYMVLSEWDALPQTFPGTELDASMLMPDHLHGIIILGTDPDVTAIPHLGTIIRAFRERSTNRYFAQVRAGIWPAIDRRLWQQRYHDRIVRSDTELDHIRTYITGNPIRWEQRNRTP